jgi:hypothetical protein
VSAVIDQATPAAPVDEETRLGRRFIAERWSALAPSTRELLMKSGCYGPRGNCVEPEDPPPSWVPETDAERLEYALGTFKRCLAAKLPMRKDRGAPVPAETLTEEVVEAAHSLLSVPQWHDAEFLRFALLAVVVHEEANALTMAAPEKSPSAAGSFLQGLGRMALMLLAPYGLASGVAAALRQDVWSATGGFFVLALGVAAAWPRQVAPTDKPRTAPRAEDDMPAHFEYAYNAWQRFKFFHIGVTGTSAQFHLERMAREGILVPAVAFDLADALRSRLHSAAAGGK